MPLKDARAVELSRRAFASFRTSALGDASGREPDRARRGEPAWPAKVVIETRPASGSSCTCGGRCAKCKAGSKAGAALLRASESSAEAAGGSIRISEPGDAHERQAEQMADRIVQAPVADKTGQLAGEGLRLDRLAEAQAPPFDLAGTNAEVREALADPGRPLDRPIRRFMEERFGIGFAHVRVHVGAAAHASATALGARAYALGDHIVFRDGAYRPDSTSGRHTLAHELTHVVQQSGRAASSTDGALSWSPIAVQPMIQRQAPVAPPPPAAARRCEVIGVSFNPGGPINVANAANPKIATFNLQANFRRDAANGIVPSCCEVRQDIQWNAALAAFFVADGTGGVPHAGFPAGAAANTWIEDRDAHDNRYGHRAGPHSDPQPFDQYLDAAGARDQASGHRYRGEDSPGRNEANTAFQGRFRFRLRVIDTCNGGRRVDSSRVLTINYL